jgi:hypothetical protein
MSIAYTWGTIEAERALAYSSDRYVEAPRDELFRGARVNAPAAVVFRWLCQLRIAPYSYDWLDNLGRRSPQRLTPGLDVLEAGQRVMSIFELVEFEQNRSITVRIIERRRARKLFGSVAVTYMVLEQPDGGCRLLAKLAMHRSRGPLAGLRRFVLAWGDLVMMRRQLLNLKRLAERTAVGAR